MSKKEKDSIDMDELSKELEKGKHGKDAKKLHKKVEEQEERIKEMADEICQLQDQVEEEKNNYFKAYADTENMKKRLQNEADMNKKYRIQSFAHEVLPVLDAFERAVQVNVEDESLKSYTKGFEMIYEQLRSALEKEGVTPIDALNQPFDPNFHQALMQEPVEGVESGIVVEELQKGYMLKDRVLRASLVKVSE